MAGLLGDIYSASNTLKRKVNGLLSDPMGTVNQFVGQLGDDTNTNINNMLVGHGLFGNKSVLTTPQQAQQARAALADYGAQSGMAGMIAGQKFVYPQGKALATAQRNAALPVEQGGLGLHPQNTPMDRAQAMGFDTPAYHGGSAEIEEFNRPVNWFAENPLFASEFSNNQSVYPVLLNNAGEFIAPKGEKTLKQWEKILTNSGVSLKDVKAVDWAPDYGKYTFFDLFPHAGNNLEMAGDGGISKAVAKKFNTVASGKEMVNSVKSGKVTAVFNPANIRSRFAAFDPMRRDSPDLLAGALPLGVMADEDSRNKLRGLLGK